MIFLTLGTHQPFDRLVRSVDHWCLDRNVGDVFGQITDPGESGYRPRGFEWTTHLPPHEYRARFASARFVIAHAGMGSIITALMTGKPILVMARRAHLGEQRNDHQVGTVERFRERPGIFVADTEAELMEALDRLNASPPADLGTPIDGFADERLTEAVNAAIRDVGRRGGGRTKSRSRKGLALRFWRRAETTWLKAREQRSG